MKVEIVWNLDIYIPISLWDPMSTQTYQIICFIEGPWLCNPGEL